MLQTGGFWKVYYYNGSTHSSLQSTSPPGRGAVLIRQNRSDGQSMIVSGEFHPSKSHFMLLNGEWKATDAESLLDIFCHEITAIQYVIKGRWVTGSQLSAIRIQAIQDPDFRSTYVEGEG